MVRRAELTPSASDGAVSGQRKGRMQFVRLARKRRDLACGGGAILGLVERDRPSQVRVWSAPSTTRPGQ